MKTAIAAALLALALTGCASSGLSGIELSQYAASSNGDKPMAGIVGGGLIAGPVGEGLSRHAKREALEAEYKALETAPSGQAVAWGDRSAGGQVVAAQPYRVGSQNCRQYAQTVTAGQDRTVRGTACRNDNGSWTVLN